MEEVLGLLVITSSRNTLVIVHLILSTKSVRIIYWYVTLGKRNKLIALRSIKTRKKMHVIYITAHKHHITGTIHFFYGLHSRDIQDTKNINGTKKRTKQIHTCRYTE